MNEIVVAKNGEEKHLILNNAKDRLAQRIEKKIKKYKEEKLQKKEDEKIETYRSALKTLSKKWIDEYLPFDHYSSTLNEDRIAEIMAIDEWVWSHAIKTLFFGSLGYICLGIGGLLFISGMMLYLFSAIFMILTFCIAFEIESDTYEKSIKLRDSLRKSLSLLKNRKSFLRKMEKEVKKLENPG